MSFTSRDILHFTNAGVTLGVDVRNGKARITYALLNHLEPRYSRRDARLYIGLRFDASDIMLKGLGLERNVVTVPYSGNKPRQDILQPLINSLREAMERRQRSGLRDRATEEVGQIVRDYARERQRKHHGNSDAEAAVAVTA